jgi:alpha-galactosidase
MKPTIALIGAGSAVFSLRLARDLCLSEDLNGATVRLHDIDTSRLDAVHRLCERYAGETGADIRFEAHLERRSAIGGADFVVNAALAASHDRLREGWAIARAHGYRFGGSLHVMHDEAFWINYYQLRLFEELLEDVLVHAPSAWYVQVANPVFAGITWLGRSYPGAKIVGLCHGYAEVFDLLDLLGLPRDEVSYTLAGVNHFIWLTGLHHGGRDVFDAISDWARDRAPDYWMERDWWLGLGPKAMDLFGRAGALPLGDTAAPGGGAWGWWYHTDDRTEHKWQEDPTGGWDRYFKRHSQTVRDIEAATAHDETKLIERFPPEVSRELVIPLIEALSGGAARVLVVNVPNDGEVVPGLPRDVAVEVAAMVSSQGIQAIPAEPLPPVPHAYLLRDRIAPVEIELAAYHRGELGLLEELVMMDPWTGNSDQAHDLVRAILDMPEHAAMRSHYRSHL